MQFVEENLSAEDIPIVSELRLSDGSDDLLLFRTLADSPEIFGAELLTRNRLSGLLCISVSSKVNSLLASPTSGSKQRKIFYSPISLVLLVEKSALAGSCCAL